ncbi:MAG: hypothetical protein E6G13_06585 [Actinobacteria bacterium]|nr:MAG: hypothetical protein E6G13_06585 [Actinomycetota bacterium]
MSESGRKRFVRTLWVAIAGAAVVDAIRHHRTHGELVGFIPYDFRMPTLERAKKRTWNPRSSRILTPTTFGVGWSVNLGRLARLAHLK